MSSLRTMLPMWSQVLFHYSVVLACVLFDSGAMHSFISSTYVKLCKLHTEPLDQNICVATPVGDAVTCRKCVDNYPIVI
jgi:hypothetical protein